MYIKELALKVADSLRNKIDGISHMQSNQGLVRFAEALIAELAKQNEPVAWCVGYDDPRMGRIHSNPTMCKPEAEALVKSTTSELIVCSLYALPPTAEQIDKETAEACAKACEDVIGNTPHDQRMLAAIDCAEMLRSGAWKEFKK